MIDQLQEETKRLRHTLAHPGHLRERLRAWLAEPDVRLGFSLIGGTAVWALYFSSVNALNSLACRWGWLGAPENPAPLKGVELAAAVLALALLAGSAYNVYTLWRQTRGQAGADAGAPGLLEQTILARTPFQAFVTLLLNVIYLLIILITLAPIVALPACAG